MKVPLHRDDLHCFGTSRGSKSSTLDMNKYTIYNTRIMVNI